MGGEPCAGRGFRGVILGVQGPGPDDTSQKCPGQHGKRSIQDRRSARFPGHRRLVPTVSAAAAALSRTYLLRRDAGRVVRAAVHARHARLHALHRGDRAGREDLAGPFAAVLDRVTHFRDGGIAGLAWRLTRELASPDAVTPLAIEGAALEMLALAARLDNLGTAKRRPPAWLLRATDMLHSRFLDGLRATDAAGEAGVHPVHLTRVFRAHHGVSLGDIALEAGFADQSHFTRAFKRHTGSTPDQFRRRMTGAR